MALVGVLLGITMCAVAWAINESRDHRKLIIELQNKVIYELSGRVNVLERRKAVLEAAATSYQATGSGPAVKSTKLRTWNEDAAPFEAKG
jgi:hypothetical protein